MFLAPGSIGIFFIGLVAGFYFGRFFDANPKLSAPALVSLLALLGVGPTALVLVQGYLQLNLLDPYGVGLVAGVVVNLIFRSLRGGEIQLEVARGRPERPAPERPAPERPAPERPAPEPPEWLGKLAKEISFFDRLKNTLSSVSSSRAALEPELATLVRIDENTYLYGKYQIRLDSYEAREGPNNPAGWVPKANLYEWGEETLSVQPISLNRIAETRDEANSLALQLAIRWINEHSTPG